MTVESSEPAIPMMPGELAGPLPRKVRLKVGEGDLRFLLPMIVLFLVGGGIYLGWICNYDFNQFQQRAILRTDAREIDGEVTGFAIRRYVPVGVFYKFIVNGTTYSGEALEPETPGPGSALDKGDNLPIRFLPSNPEVNHPAAWEWTADTAWIPTAGVVGVVFIGAGILVGILREWKLARFGKAVLGVVLGCTPNGRLIRVEYEFKTENGNSIRGNTSRTDELGAGERIWVLYLPQHPRRNHRYPSDFFEAVK